MAKLMVEFDVRREHDDEFESDDHGPVSIYHSESQSIRSSREIRDVEDAVWCLEAPIHRLVWDVWEHVDAEEYDGWGFRSPYPTGSATVSLSGDVSIHHVAAHIAEREDAETLGVYMDVLANTRLEYDSLGVRKILCEYLAYEGYDTGYWTHGVPAGGYKMLTRKMPDE